MQKKGQDLRQKKKKAETVIYIHVSASPAIPEAKLFDTLHHRDRGFCL